MARSLGSLVVSLGLNSAEYTAGLTKAERQAQQFAQRTRSAILEVGKVLGTLEIGRQFFENTKEIIAEAAALNDLAGATGATVEQLSKLNNQAKIAGTDFATIQNALLKLSAGMAGTDEETTKAKDALKLLGITTRDPVEALQQLAVKLDGYADGVNKAGLLQAIFGKSFGPILLALKDMAQLQDVAATTTTKQAQEAQKLTQEFNRLSVEATGFKNAILNDVVGPLTNAIEQFRIGIQVAGGFFDALRLFGTIKSLANPTAQLRELNQELANLEATKAQGGLGERINAALGIGADVRIADVKKQIEFATLLQRQQQELQRSFRQAPGAKDKPDAPFIASDKAGKATRERTSDTENFIKSLEKQLQATLDLNAEETILVELYKLQKDAQSGLTASSEALIRDYAQQLKFAEDLKKAAEEKKRADEASLRVDEEIRRTQLQQFTAEQQAAQQIKDGNEAIREQIVFLKGGEEAVRKLTDAKIADTIAEKERQAAAIEGLPGSAAQVDAIRKTIEALKERQAVLKEADIAKKFAEEARALQDVKNMISDTFADAFTDFITGAKSAKDAFKQFTDSLVQQISRIAAQNIANKLFGGTNQAGPDFFGVIAKLFGASGGSAVTSPFGGAFAMGGTTRGGWSVVGERGPEIAQFPPGTKITPNHQINRGGGSVTNNIGPINVLPGATTATARQAAKEIERRVRSQSVRG